MCYVKIDAVKNKTGLAQSIGSVKFLSCAIVVMLVLALRYPSRYTIGMLVVLVLYCAMDAINIVVIKRRASRDPTYLDKKMT